MIFPVYRVHLLSARIESRAGESARFAGVSRSLEILPDRASRGAAVRRGANSPRVRKKKKKTARTAVLLLTKFSHRHFFLWGTYRVRFAAVCALLWVAGVYTGNAAFAGAISTPDRFHIHFSFPSFPRPFLPTMNGSRVRERVYLACFPHGRFTGERWIRCFTKLRVFRSVCATYAFSYRYNMTYRYALCDSQVTLHAQRPYLYLIRGRIICGTRAGEIKK